MSINTETGRKYDYWKNTKVPNGCCFIVRLDGNCFSRFTEQYKRPFDEDFFKAINSSVRYLMTNITDIYRAHFHSDEISLYFVKDSEWFDQRILKTSYLL